MIAPGNDGAERYPEIEVFAIAARDCYVTLAISRSAGRLSTKSTYRRPLGLQLSRLMESLGSAPSTPQANSPPAAQAAAAEPKSVSDCFSEQAALDRLRSDPSIDAAQAFWSNLQCERLRPQARMLMESLDILPEEPTPHPGLREASAALPPKANDTRAVVAPGDSAPAGPAACDREKEELTRLRANPDRRDAESFVRGMTCETLKPQAARLLESLTD